MTLPTIASAITFLETQIEELDKRRARLVAALDGLRMLADSDEEAETRQVERRQPARPLAPAPRRANEDGGRDDKVLQALKNGKLQSPMLTQLTGLSKHQLYPVIDRLLTKKAITKTGKKKHTFYQLTTN